MVTMEDLPIGFYSGEPGERVAALANTTDEVRNGLLGRIPQWPKFSPGSLNAWLVFLGPSPGNSPGGDWDYDPNPSIGCAHPGVAEYLDGKGFWNGIRDYASAVFDELDASGAYAATMVRNLDPHQSANAPKGSHMSTAARQVFEVLGKVVRPRMVIALGGSRQYTDKAVRVVSSVREHKSGTLYTARSREGRPLVFAGRQMG